MTIEDLIGAEIIEIKKDSYKTEIITNKGIIVAGMGDCGTLRSPEPYNYFRILPIKHCRNFGGFDICGEELPCKFHD